MPSSSSFKQAMKALRARLRSKKAVPTTPVVDELDQIKRINDMLNEFTNKILEKQRQTEGLGSQPGPIQPGKEIPIDSTVVSKQKLINERLDQEIADNLGQDKKQLQRELATEEANFVAEQALSENIRQAAIGLDFIFDGKQFRFFKDGPVVTREVLEPIIKNARRDLFDLRARPKEIVTVQEMISAQRRVDDLETMHRELK